jgi:hypothetical protein
MDLCPISIRWYDRDPANMNITISKKAILTINILNLDVDVILRTRCLKFRENKYTDFHFFLFSIGENRFADNDERTTQIGSNTRQFSTHASQTVKIVELM